MPNKSLEEMVIEIAAEHGWSQGDVLIMACEFIGSRELESFFLAWLVNEANEQDEQLLRDEISTDEDYDSGLTPEDIEHDGRIYYPPPDDDNFLNYEPDEP